MSASKIDWCDETINFFTGCRNGCKFCYARKFARRLAGIKGTVYERVKEQTADPFRPAVHLDVSRKEETRLERTRKPRRVFVGSMGDMCFEKNAAVYGSDGERLRVLGGWNTDDIQAHSIRFCRTLLNKGHSFLFLTKRPDLLSGDLAWSPNMHVGTSVTSNLDAHRTFELHKWYVDTKWKPGAIWASVEPLLDPNFDTTFLTVLDWVVIGGQTGPGGIKTSKDRGALLASAKHIVSFCAVSGIPCFVKDNMRSLDDGFNWPRAFPQKGEKGC